MEMGRVTKPKFTRDNVLFTAGLIGMGWQTIVDQVDRPTLLLIFGGMMGLPVFMRIDETRKQLLPETRVVETDEEVTPRKLGN